MPTNLTKHTASVSTTRIGGIAAWDDLLASWDNAGGSTQLWGATTYPWLLFTPWLDVSSTGGNFLWDNAIAMTNSVKHSSSPTNLPKS